MNIKRAKEEIKNSMLAYFTKDPFDNYKIPIEKQRPIFLMGAPGIGKTAIMEQVAQELRRQSALGLPFIEKKIYNGGENSVSDHTMSEIIAFIASVYDSTVYDSMEATD